MRRFRLFVAQCLLYSRRTWIWIKNKSSYVKGFPQWCLWPLVVPQIQKSDRLRLFLLKIQIIFGTVHNWFMLQEQVLSSHSVFMKKLWGKITKVGIGFSGKESSQHDYTNHFQRICLHSISTQLHWGRVLSSKNTLILRTGKRESITRKDCNATPWAVYFSVFYQSAIMTF